jgi:hypothetical protein
MVVQGQMAATPIGLLQTTAHRALAQAGEYLPLTLYSAVAQAVFRSLA